MFARYYRARHGGGGNSPAQKVSKTKKKKPGPVKKRQSQRAPLDKKRKSSDDDDDDDDEWVPPTKKAKTDSVGVRLGTRAAAAWKRVSEAVGLGRKGNDAKLIQQQQPGESSSQSTVLDKNWLDLYQQLVEFKREHGHCRVPTDYKHNKHLGNWVCRQRKRYSHGTLMKVREKMLQDLGFAFHVRNEEWMERYQELGDFKEKHGHCKVPNRYEDNKALGYWVSHQREYFKQGKLSKERIEMLNELSFDWKSFTKPPKKPKECLSLATVLEKNWLDRYHQLVEFKRKNGHCNVPDNKHNKHLANWVHRQRMNYTHGSISNDREKMLQDLGFEFQVLELNWMERYQELVDFKATYGHCKVPNRYKHNKALGKWVSRQREIFKIGKISKERIEKLNELGFEWCMSSQSGRSASINY